jgi:hypothetical protein
MDQTLGRLRDIWRSVIEGSGGHCPVCDRWGKITPIRMTHTTVRSLVWLRNIQDTTGQPWIHVPSVAPRFVMRSYSISSLKHWGLVQQRAEVPEPKTPGAPRTKFSGHWRITPLGREFAAGQIAVPQAVFVYNDSVWGKSDKEVYARDCFKEQFDYDAVMSSTLAGKEE